MNPLQENSFTWEHFNSVHITAAAHLKIHLYSIYSFQFLLINIPA